RAAYRHYIFSVVVVTVTAGFVRYGYYLKLLLPTVRFLHFTPPLTFSGAPCGTHDTYSEIHHCPSDKRNLEDNYKLISPFHQNDQEFVGICLTRGSVGKTKSYCG
uniref:Uncharacterized protein n=1 Tax=Cynoglossus semilaevis TaxID=244447 RepID=A0A3P8VQ20_CYNSE